MKTLLNLIICFLICSSGVAQTSVLIDSLNASLKNEKLHDTLKIDLIYSLGVEHLDFNIEKAKIYADQALDLSIKNEKLHAVEIYTLLGLLEFENSNGNAARDFYDQALLELDKNDNKEKRATIYGNYSVTYENTDNFEKELEYSLKAINLSKDNNTELCFLYFNHSIIYQDAGLYEESVKYLNLAHDISKMAKDLRMEAFSLRNLAYYAIEEKKYDAAQDYLNRGLEICNELDSPEVCINIHLILGKLYVELKIYDKAEISLIKSKEIAKSREQKGDVLASNLLLGELELKKGNYKTASQLFNEIKFELSDIDDITMAGLAYENWAEAEFEIGNHKKSNQLLKKYITINNAILQSKNRNLLVNADRKYETEKKDKEIISQQLQLKENENELQKKNSESNYMLGIIAFLIVASILTWFLYQQKEKRKNQELLTLKRDYQIKTLESLIEGEEKERFRIAKELHDGVNGDLSAIKYKLSSLLEMNNKVIKEAITMIDDSCKQVRAISHNLLPPSLENFNLIEAVEVYCDNLNNVTPSNIAFQHIGEAVIVSKKAEINIFRIIQELITNSIKHAEASQINVQISSRENIVQITVEDDGKGFNVNNQEDKGIGLKNVQSRVEYLKSSIDLISNNQGTSYTIEIDKENVNEN